MHSNSIFDGPMGTLERSAKMALVEVFEAAAGTFWIIVRSRTPTKSSAIAMKTLLAEVRPLLVHKHSIVQVSRPHVAFEGR